jgi:hypothetical protein
MGKLAVDRRIQVGERPAKIVSRINKTKNEERQNHGSSRYS